jgi:hypothetical protein
MFGDRRVALLQAIQQGLAGGVGRKRELEYAGPNLFPENAEEKHGHADGFRRCRRGVSFGLHDGWNGLLGQGGR